MKEISSLSSQFARSQFLGFLSIGFRRISLRSRALSEKRIGTRTTIEVKPGLAEATLLLVLEKVFGAVLKHPSVNRRTKLPDKRTSRHSPLVVAPPPPPAVDVPPSPTPPAVSEVMRTKTYAKRTSRRSPLPPLADVPLPPPADVPPPPAVDGPLKSEDVPPLKKQKLKSDPEDVKIKSHFQWSSRCRGLFELIQNFNQKQKSDIESVGFGGLLHLKLRTNPNSCMLRWLVDSFNPGSRMLQIDGLRGFAVTPDDVFDVFMLPRNPGVEVLSYAKSNKVDQSPILDRFKSDYVIFSGVSFSCLENALKDKFPNGGDDFIRIFVLYALLSFLDPSPNRLVITKYLKSLEVIQEISKFDWCSFILDKLCESIKRYKTGICKVVGGCVLLLQILYFHRLKWQGISEPSTLPLLKHWTIKKVSDRCSQELEAGKYGSGELVVNTYPISLNGVVPGQVSEGVGSKEKDCSQKVRLEVDGKFKDMQEFFISLKKDANVFTDKYMTKLVEIGREVHVNNDNAESSSPPMDEDFFKSIDRLVEMFYLTKKLANQMPNFRILSPSPVDTSAYGWDRSILEELVGGDMHREGGTDAEKKAAEYSDSEREEEDVTPVGDAEISEAINSVGVKAKNVGVDCKSVFWSLSESVGYLSDFMIYNNRFLYEMQQSHKEVVDLCFCDFNDDSLSMDYFFFIDPLYYLKKEDVESLIPGEWICQTIINSWSFIVNNDCWLDNGRKRFILSTDHSVLLDSLLHENLDVKEFELELKKFWSKWLNVTKDTIVSVDMIFIPFCFLNHYAAVVINFLDRKIQYLDNRKYSDEDLEKNFTDVANLLVSHMTSFLDERKHPEADQIKKYDFEVVNFKWKTTKSNDDCGVFLMHHLKHFNGVVYDSPNLSKVTIRRVLRAEFCASILLSNLNQCRPDLVDKANSFYQNKPDLIARKSEARRKSKAARKVTFLTLVYVAMLIN
ncbi:hypothetical protein ACS0TY_003579 [Phlomoides rotata]